MQHCLAEAAESYEAGGTSGLKLATSVWGLKLLVFEALSY